MSPERGLEPRTNLQVQLEYERLNKNLKNANNASVLSRLAERAERESELAKDSPEQAAGWQAFHARVLMRSAILRKNKGLPILIGWRNIENEPDKKINDLIFVFDPEDDQPYITRIKLYSLKQEFQKEKPGKKIKTILKPYDDVSAFEAKYDSQKEPGH